MFWQVYKEGKLSAYFGRMKEGDYLSVKGPKVWPSCSFLIGDTFPF